MAQCEKLLKKAKASSSNVTYGELTKLAECHGWFEKRSSGSSHVIYFNPNAPTHKAITFVKCSGKVASWQVTGLLAAIQLLEK